jgi:hypothetical protein
VADGRGEWEERTLICRHNDGPRGEWDVTQVKINETQQTSLGLFQKEREGCGYPGRMRLPMAYVSPHVRTPNLFGAVMIHSLEIAIAVRGTVSIS